MRQTAKIVAQTIAFTPLDSLENHYLSEINTWTNDDEITEYISEDFLNDKEPSFESPIEEENVYPAHIVSGAVIALAESVDISRITDLAISALNKSYKRNPVWHGYPIRYRSDFFMHSMYLNWEVIP